MSELIQLLDGVAIKRFAIDKPMVRIGRNPNSDIYIEDKVVSKEHAVIETEEDPDQGGGQSCYIRDLGSINSTYVNGKKITRQKLKNNDFVRIGINTFKFIEGNDNQSDQTLKMHKTWLPKVFYTKE
ncbi:MAG: FHA domain-containing protein [bacterium]